MIGRVATFFGTLTVATALVACGGSSEPAEPVADSEQKAEGPRSGVTELASATLEDGREVVLRSRGAGSETGPCLSVVGVDRQVRACGRAPSERVPSRANAPIIAESIAQARPSAPFEVYGATSAAVARVVLRFEVDGGDRRRMPAVLMRVSDEAALQDAGISEPFGYFLGELPSETSRVTAIALDPDRAVVGSASYEHMSGLHPRAFITGRP